MIEIKNLSKKFIVDGEDFYALKDVSLEINDGDIYGIIGMSGAGKSTLVRSINMLERPTDGSVVIDGIDMSSLSKKELRKKRREITMIFQSFNLLMQKNVLKNVMFPLLLQGTPKRVAKEKALELLDVVGLKEKANSFPAQLSGGQQQRVAIARALTTNPKVLLCDEATSALDPNTTNQILSLIKNINKKYNITVVVITHQMSVIESICNNVAIIDHGEVVEKGEVTKVFSSPKSSAAKKLVLPTDETGPLLSMDTNKRMIRVVYNGANAANKPLIASMAKDIGVLCNIAYASTKSLGDKAYGSMILTVDGDDEDLIKAAKYIREIPDIVVEEVNPLD